MAATHLFARAFRRGVLVADKASSDLPSFLLVAAVARPATRWPAGRGRPQAMDHLRKLDPLAAHFQSQGLASDPPGGRSRDVPRRLRRQGAGIGRPEMT